MSSSRDEPRRQNAPDRGTAGQGEAVKPSTTGQRVERSPARDEGQSNAGSAGLWEQVWERQNLLGALHRVESNRGAPGVDGMTGEELRPHLINHWLEIREALDGGRYRPSPVRRVGIPKPEGGERQLGIPIPRSHCTSIQWALGFGTDWAARAAQSVYHRLITLSNDVTSACAPVCAVCR